MALRFTVKKITLKNNHIIQYKAFLIFYYKMDAEHYRNVMIQFMNNHKKDIARIYHTHAEQDGAGLIVLDLQSNNVDIIFVKKEAIPEHILNEINKLENTTNVIYIYMITPCEERLVEVDFRDLI